MVDQTQFTKMPKWRFISNVLNINLIKLCVIVLGIIAIVQLLSTFGYYNYKYVPRDKIQYNLFKSTNPNLAKVASNPNCDYTFVTGLESVDLDNILPSLHNFSTHGIERGNFVPDYCNPLFSTAILVTYRNRQEQLNIFIPYIHNFLRHQNIHYKIFVIEQQDEKPWNKGLLYNIGAKVAISEKFPCLILQDVDLLPLDRANVYSCTYRPRHMSACVDKFRYVLPYESLVGGVTAIRSKHFTQVNGFSNRFTDWGGEDDDFERRISHQNLSVIRFPPEMSRYIMLKHQQEKINVLRNRILAENVGHYSEEGLNTAKYQSIKIINYRLFTLIGVKL